MLNKILKLIKVIIIAIPVVILFWLASKQLALGGKMEVVYNLKTPSPFISPLRPEDRVGKISKDETGNYWQAIIDDPIYFNLIVPQKFDQATVQIIYQNKNLPIFQIGAATDLANWQYAIKPLENKILDQLTWLQIKSGEIVLWQRKKVFNTIDEFFNNTPPAGQIVVYNYDLASREKAVHFTPQIDLDRSGINYIIAAYFPPQEAKGEKIAKQTFSLGGLYREVSDNYKYAFLLSAPGVNPDDGLQIKEIKIALERPPLRWTDFASKVKRFIFKKLRI